MTAILAGGCGAAVPNTNGGPATVQVKQSSIGPYLVDDRGHALYLFEKDEMNESYCYGACASIWPPFETNGQLHTAGGLPSSRLTTFKREDGDLQVAYEGHPLYYYAGDASNVGKTAGQGLEQFGAEWYLVAPSGKPQESEGS